MGGEKGAFCGDDAEQVRAGVAERVQGESRPERQGNFPGRGLPGELAGALIRRFDAGRRWAPLDAAGAPSNTAGLTSVQRAVQQQRLERRSLRASAGRRQSGGSPSLLGACDTRSGDDEPSTSPFADPSSIHRPLRARKLSRGRASVFPVPFVLFLHAVLIRGSFPSPFPGLQRLRRQERWCVLYACALLYGVPTVPFGTADNPSSWGVHRPHRDNSAEGRDRGWDWFYGLPGPVLPFCGRYCRRREA